MISDDFYPNKIRKAKLYVEATIRDVEQNYPVKKSFFKKIRQFFKKLFFRR